jgi:hypothetical protein
VKPKAQDCLTILNRYSADRLPEAVYEVATGYEFGHMGLRPSAKRAKKLYEEAAELGSVDAMKRLGDLSALGMGVKMNRTKARKFYRMAADRGHAEAQHNIGVLLTHPSEDRIIATNGEHRIVATTGTRTNSCSFTARARCPPPTCEGDSVEEGLLYLLNSGFQGYTPAECMLGRCYGVGIGCEADLQKSYFWYSRAAAKGDEAAKAILERGWGTGSTSS